MKRWGIAKKSDESNDTSADFETTGTNYVIAIRPAITDILGETALMRLAQWSADSNTATNTEEGHEVME